MSCAHPYVKPTTGYRYGCRCDRCSDGIKKRPKYKRTGRRIQYRAVALPSRNPDYERPLTRRVTSKAYGGC